MHCSYSLALKGYILFYHSENHSLIFSRSEKYSVLIPSFWKSPYQKSFYLLLCSYSIRSLFLLSLFSPSKKYIYIYILTFPPGKRHNLHPPAPKNTPFPIFSPRKIPNPFLPSPKNPPILILSLGKTPAPLASIPG